MHKQWQAGPETNQKPSRQLVNFSLPQAHLTKAQQPGSKSTGYCRVGLCCRHNYTLLLQVGAATSQNRTFASGDDGGAEGTFAIPIPRQI